MYFIIFYYLKASWSNTEYNNPNVKWFWNGIVYQSTDDKSKEISQKKALAISIIIFIGSLAIVNANMANGGPKAKEAQPKKSITVIFVGMNA